MSGVNDYQVLNVRVKYSGGVAAYLNGNLVARFNLEDDFDSTSLSITDHDSTIFSKFHVILATAGIQEGSNVFSFEIHRGLSGSSSDPVVFDATGVFGVEDCSTVVDSYSSLESTNPSSGTIVGIMDLDPFTTGLLPNTIGTYIEWTVENLEGSKWNSFNMVGGSTVTSWGFDIIANYNPDDTTNEPVTILSAIGQTVTSRTKPQIAVPVALAGFRRYRWEVTDTGSTTTTLGSVHMAYCKPTGSVCPRIGNYPSVGEGQISPSSCPEGYRGYSYRECSNGVLGEVKMDHCVQKPPMNASYRPSQNRFVMGTAVTTGVPSVRNIVDRWYIDTGVTLPAGLTLNSQTGEISGIPTVTCDLTFFTISAENESGTTQAMLSIEVRKGRCIAEGRFPTIEVGQEAVIECSSLGDYTSTLRRACILGSEDGVWQQTTGKCIPITSFSYPQSSFALSKNDPFSITPTVIRDQLSFSIISGSLPIGLSLNSSTGIISGIPSQSVSSQSVTIKAFNEVSDQSFSLSFTIQLIPSSLNYNQTIFIIQNNTYFSTTPYCEGDDLSFSIISGSLPIGLSFDSSTGIISGTPLSSIPLTNITIQAFNQVGSTQFTISIQVMIPLSNLHYSQFSFTLIKGQSFSISPIISGDNPVFTITSGTLPPGLSLNQSTGIISGIPSSTFPSTSITIQASNQLGFIQTQLSFTVNALSTLTIILISLSILIILIILIIIILIILSKKKKHTLPKKSIEEVKSVENRIPNPSHSV
ncbi:hypothetical protein WA171_005134 [Blastocystis sp. BT1]